MPIAIVNIEVVLDGDQVERVAVGSEQTPLTQIPGVVAEMRRNGVLFDFSEHADSSLLIEGEQQLVRFGEETSFGAVRIRVPEPTVEAMVPEQSKNKKEASSPLILLMMPIAIGILLWVFLGEEGVEVAQGERPQAPELWSAQEQCPNEAGPTHHRAERYERAAIAKLQRYPFNPQDGVQSVILFQRARACFQASGDSDAARHAGALGDRAHNRVEEHYRSRLFRLERALEKERLEEAWLEAHGLASLLEHRGDDPYVDWLRQLERDLRRSPAGGQP